MKFTLCCKHTEFLLNYGPIGLDAVVMRKLTLFGSYLGSSATSTSVGAVMGALECPAVGSSVFSSPFVEGITCTVKEHQQRSDTDTLSWGVLPHEKSANIWIDPDKKPLRGRERIIVQLGWSQLKAASHCRQLKGKSTYFLSKNKLGLHLIKVLLAAVIPPVHSL